MSRTAEAANGGSGASLRRVIEAASRLGLDIEPVRLDDSTRTAADAARACGCALGQIVKSIVFRVADTERHVLFLTAGDRRVEPERAGALVGAKLEKADAAGVRKHTGFAIGGVAPLGHLNPIETFLDDALLGYDVVWAAAGTPNHVFAVRPQALVRALRPRVVSFAG
jgi:prolyl-tRNA editing enzyme YbaK/EbsC (Cys-tRNA(Pro) deacylase)